MVCILEKSRYSAMDSQDGSSYTGDGSRDAVDNMEDDMYMGDDGDPSVCDLEPVSRSRANTWHGLHLEQLNFKGSGLGNTTPGGSSCTGSGGTPSLSKESLLGIKKSSTGGRKNAWGNLSYADLITQAIESSPERRLTLGQIYDWMTKNVPYFCERSDAGNSGGWKNSIRHNLSLHNKFRRLANEGGGKCSHWVIDYDAVSAQAKAPVSITPRRRANTLDSKLYDKKRLAAAKGRVRLPKNRGELFDSAESLNPMLFRSSGVIGSNASSVHRLSPSIDPINEEHDDMAWENGASRANVGKWLNSESSWEGYVDTLGDSLHATSLTPENTSFNDIDLKGAASAAQLHTADSSVPSYNIGDQKQFSTNIIPGINKPVPTNGGVWSAGASNSDSKFTSTSLAENNTNSLYGLTHNATSNVKPYKAQDLDDVESKNLADSERLKAIIEKVKLEKEQLEQKSLQETQKRFDHLSLQKNQLENQLNLQKEDYLMIISHPDFWTNASPKLASKVRETLLAKKAEILEAERLRQEDLCANASPIVSNFESNGQQQQQLPEQLNQQIKYPSSAAVRSPSATSQASPASVSFQQALSPTSASFSLQNSPLVVDSLDVNYEDIFTIIRQDMGEADSSFLDSDSVGNM